MYVFTLVILYSAAIRIPPYSWVHEYCLISLSSVFPVDLMLLTKYGILHFGGSLPQRSFPSVDQLDLLKGIVNVYFKRTITGNLIIFIFYSISSSRVPEHKETWFVHFKTPPPPWFLKSLKPCLPLSMHISGGGISIGCFQHLVLSA